MNPSPDHPPKLGIVLPFTRCRRCITFRKILKSPDYQCAQCDLAKAAERDRRVERETDAWVRRLMVSAVIVVVCVGLMAFCNVARPFL